MGDSLPPPPHRRRLSHTQPAGSPAPMQGAGVLFPRHTIQRPKLEERNSRHCGSAGVGKQHNVGRKKPFRRRGGFRRPCDAGQQSAVGGGGAGAGVLSVRQERDIHGVARVLLGVQLDGA